MPKNECGRINIEMIPFTMWGKNLRILLSTTTWANLRYLFNATSDKPDYFMFSGHPLNDYGLALGENPKCKICQTEYDELELHEVWKFNDRSRVQKLVDLIPVCNLCHFSIHFGRASQLGKQKEVIGHIQRVNQWTKTKVKQQITVAQNKWLKRSRYHYELDLNWFENLFPDVTLHYENLNKSTVKIFDRISSIEWANRVLGNPDYVILDTETTGLLKTSESEIIELSILSMNGRKRYSARFKPLKSIPRRTTKIHGITNKAVRNCPSFKSEYKKICKILEGKTIIAYNSKFDKGIFDRTCKFHGCNIPDINWECAMWAYKYFMNARWFLPLPESEHNSLDDCRATLKIIKKIAKG